MTTNSSKQAQGLNLVIGATGNVGRHVVRRLLEAGAPVRAASRQPEKANLPAGVQVVQADLTQPETLPRALDGVSKVFLYVEPRGIDGFVAAAQAALVKHVVLLSSVAVLMEGADANPLARRHLDVERPLEASGIPWTFIRPGAFATNSLNWAGSIRAEGAVRSAYPEAHSAPIHEKDMADVAVRALLDPGYEMKSYVLSGPESLTQRRQLELISEAIGRQLRFEVIPVDQARAELSKTWPPMVVDTLLRAYAMLDGVPATVVDTVREVTGQPARTFGEWAKDHADDFR